MLFAAEAKPSSIWLHRNQIMNLPASGTAWDNVKAAADNAPVTPNLSNKDSSENVRVMARALVYVRTGTASYRDTVLTQLQQVIGTQANITDGMLALARELAAYVIAADLVKLPSGQEKTFKDFLRAVRTQTLEGRTLISTHEDRPNNWGTMASASRLAVGIYLGEKSEINRVARVFHGWLGDRTKYAGFQYDADVSWQANPALPVGINPLGAVKDGRNFDGILPEEQRRTGSYLVSNPWPPPQGTYPWEALQGVIATAHMLARRGFDAWNWQNQAIKRAITWLVNENLNPATGDDRWMMHVINQAYGTTFTAATPATPGKNVGWTDWTHQNLSLASTATMVWIPLNPIGSLPQTREAGFPLQTWTPLTASASVAGGGSTADQDFAYRRTLPGVIKYVDFDNYVEIFDQGVAGQRGGVLEPSGANRFSNWVNAVGTVGPFSHGIYSNVYCRLDTSVKSSGASSLQFRTPTRSGAGVAGAYRTNFTDLFTNATEREEASVQAGEHVFVQFRYRVNSGMLRAFAYDAAHGGPTSKTEFKIAIVGFGDINLGPPSDQYDDQPIATSCSTVEFVCQADHRIPGSGSFVNGPAMYHGCSVFDNSIITDVSGTHGISTATRLQNAVGFSTGSYCLYSPSGFDPGAAVCFDLIPDQWMTFMMGIICGNYGGVANTRYLLWGAYDGQPFQLLGDSWIKNPDGYQMTTPRTVPDESAYRYGKVHLLPYMSFKGSDEVHADADCWYDEVIISRHKLPPAGQGARSALCQAAKDLAEGAWVILNQEGQPNANGLAFSLLASNGASTEDAATEYSDKAEWDAVNDEIQFAGQSHPNNTAGRHFRYREDTNSWSSVGSPAWYGAGTDTTPRHAYKHNALYPLTGDLYHRVFQSRTVGRWRRATNTYTAAHTTWPGSGNTEGGTCFQWFPQRQRFVFIDGYEPIMEWNPVTNVWTRQHQGRGASFGDSTFYNLYMQSGNGALYNPVTESIWLGGQGGRLCEYKKDGTLNESVAVCPVSFTMTQVTQVFTLDPVSGHLLVFHQSGALYEYNQTSNTWTRRNGSGGLSNLEPAIPIGSPAFKGQTLFGVLAVPIPKYGVIGFLKTNVTSGGGCKFYLYKHKVT